MVHRRGDQQKRRLENQPPANAKQNFLQKRFEVSRNNTGWLAELVRIILPDLSIARNRKPAQRIWSPRGSGPSYLSPTNLWSSGPLGQRTSTSKDARSEGDTVNALCSFGATAKVFRDRGVRFCHSRRYLVKSRSHRGHSTLWITWPTI